MRNMMNERHENSPPILAGTVSGFPRPVSEAFGSHPFANLCFEMSKNPNSINTVLASRHNNSFETATAVCPQFLSKKKKTPPCTLGCSSCNTHAKQDTSRRTQKTLVRLRPLSEAFLASFAEFYLATPFGFEDL
jgi:hypothetical protein